jgi:hypothetical protein
MGLSTALYRRSLLCIDSVDLLPSSKCICFAFRLSCFLFVLMCFACYHSIQNLLCSCVLSENLKFKIYKTIILPLKLTHPLLKEKDAVTKESQ